jgi:outer membrane lipoprotein carrier protein
VIGAAVSAEESFRGRRESVRAGCGRGILPRTPAKGLFCARRCCRAVASVFPVALLCVSAAFAATLAIAAAAPPPAAAPAAPAIPQQPTPLDAYLDNLRTLRATFLQTLADPHGREIDRAKGTLVVDRPGRFSWEIHPQPAADSGGGSSGSGAASAGQLMVCDGKNLWFLDRDLQQVTVKPVDSALSATPAMLLSGTVDVRKNFKITPAGQRIGLTWVLVEPQGAQADFRDALFGFDHGELKRMILEDKLDQTATIVFEKVERNGPVSPSEVSFTPPPGTDVIGKPRQ